MKNYLCFGDSNTWGYIPGSSDERYPYGKRICGILQKNLGSEYRVIEEALNGRMTCWDDPLNENKNATHQLSFILDSHRPLDLVSIMLGINDMKHYMNVDPIDSALGIGKLVDIIKAANCGPNGQVPEILIIAPPAYIDGEKPYGRIFQGAAEKSKGFAAAYREIADSHNTHFLDAGPLATPPASGDGVHIDGDGCSAIATAITDFITGLAAR